MATKRLLILILSFLLTLNKSFCQAEQTVKNNGDIFVSLQSYNSDESDEKENIYQIDLNEVMSICNSSFSIPMGYLTHFNQTGELPDIVDKTAPCYIRCFYEKAGLINNWKLNGDRIRQIMWPATGNSLEVCQEEGRNESNACLRTYAIAKCLMMHALVDARSSIQK